MSLASPEIGHREDDTVMSHANGADNLLIRPRRQAGLLSAGAAG